MDWCLLCRLPWSKGRPSLGAAAHEWQLCSHLTRLDPPAYCCSVAKNDGGPAWNIRRRASLSASEQTAPLARRAGAVTSSPSQVADTHHARICTALQTQATCTIVMQSRRCQSLFFQVADTCHPRTALSSSHSHTVTQPHCVAGILLSKWCAHRVHPLPAWGGAAGSPGAHEGTNGGTDSGVPGWEVGSQETHVLQCSQFCHVS